MGVPSATVTSNVAALMSIDAEMASEARKDAAEGDKKKSEKKREAANARAKAAEEELAASEKGSWFNVAASVVAVSAAIVGGACTGGVGLAVAGCLAAGAGGLGATGQLLGQSDKEDAAEANVLATDAEADAAGIETEVTEDRALADEARDSRAGRLQALQNLPA